MENLKRVLYGFTRGKDTSEIRLIGIIIEMTEHSSEANDIKTLLIDHLCIRDRGRVNFVVLPCPGRSTRQVGQR
jgi:hypothetical protein